MNNTKKLSQALRTAVSVLLGVIFLCSGILSIFANGETGESTNNTSSIIDTLKNNLLLYSSFDGENVNDESGKGHNGTVVGSVSYVDGMSGKAIVIDGNQAGTGSGKTDYAATNYVNYGPSANIIPATGDFSVSMMFKFTGETLPYGGVLLSNKDYTRGINAGFAIVAGDETSSRKQRMNFGDGSNNKNAGTKTVADDGQWHMITAVYDRDGKVMFYFDGSLVSEDDISGGNGRSITSAGLPLILGADGDKCYGMIDSVIDELCIYDKVLSADEIGALYSYFTGDTKKIETRLNEMLSTVKTIVPGILYSQDKLTAVKSALEVALNELPELDYDEAVVLLEECEKEYEALFYSGAKPIASFHIISDVHSYNGDDAYVAALQNMANINADTNIGLLVTGDITNSATEKQYNSFYNKTEAYSPVSDEKVMVVLGNHDVRGSSNRYSTPDQYNAATSNWETAKNYYLTRNEKYMPSTDTVYYTKELGGYTFIMLNTELDLSDALYMSVEQLEWLEQTLKTAYEKDPTKPIFIASHQPLYDTHFESNRWRTFIVGDMKTGEFMNEEESNNAIKAVLEKYPTTVFISGHIHNGFGTTVGVVRPFGATIDLPALGKGSNMGGGYEAQIYENQIIFRAINYATGEYLPQYDIVIATGDNNVSAIYQKSKRIIADADKYSAEDIENVRSLSDQLYALLNVKYTDVELKAFYTLTQHEEINTVAQTLKATIDALKTAGGTDSDVGDGSGDGMNSGDDTNNGTETDITDGNDENGPIEPIVIVMIAAVVAVCGAAGVFVALKKNQKK